MRMYRNNILKRPSIFQFFKALDLPYTAPASMFQGKNTRKKKEKSKNNYKSPIEVFSKNQAHKHALILNNDKRAKIHLKRNMMEE